MVADRPKPGAELIIQHLGKRFLQRNSRVTTRLDIAGATNIELMLPNNGEIGKLYDDQLLLAERMVFLRQCGATKIKKHLPEPPHVQLNNIAEILIKRPRQIPNLYWQRGQPIGAPVSNLRQIKYIPLPNTLPDID